MLFLSSILLVEVVDAVDSIGGVDGERNAVQAEVANDAGETLRMVGFAGGAQNSIQDRFRADAAFLQAVL